jgi:hypothetical protein
MGEPPPIREYWLRASPKLWRALLPSRKINIHIACSNVAKVPSFERVEIRTGEAIDCFNQTIFGESAQVAPQKNLVPRAR